MPVRITNKLMWACDILSGERYGDFDEGFLLDQVKRGRFTREQIYSAVEHFGYRWKKSGWERTFPRWLDSLIEREMDRGLSRYDPVTRAQLRVISRVSRTCN